MSVGSIVRYGLAHLFDGLEPNLSILFLIASWWEPENATYAISPAYGCLGLIGKRLYFSYTSMISSIFSRWSSGSIPWQNILSATVITSVLPVLSPLPNIVPSTLSAPASNASSLDATPVPLSLCAWTLITRCSRLLRCLHIYSIWSAYTFAVATSIVDGRFTITLFVSDGLNTSSTAFVTSAA